MRIFLATSTLLAFTLGCGGGSTTTPPAAPPAPTPAPTPEAPKAEAGYFVWFNPGKTLYRSTADASTWTAVAGTFPADLSNWYISIAADAGGRLYAGKSPAALFHSEDAGKTWAPVPQSAAPAGTVDYRFCAGAADEIYGVGSDGSGIYSTDAGQSWTVGRFAAEGAKGAGDGFNGGCAFSATGELLADGWYFDPPGPITATSKDHGVTWTALPRAATNTSTDGVGYVGGTMYYAQHGGYTGAKVSRFDATKSAWTETPELKGAADREWALTAFATDGAKVVGWENPSKNAAGPVKSFIQVSDDGGATFHAVPGPVAADPTPDTWDEYIAMGWHNGKTPGPMPAAKPVAAIEPARPLTNKALPKPPGGTPRLENNNPPAATPKKSPTVEETRKKNH